MLARGGIRRGPQVSQMRQPPPTARALAARLLAAAELQRAPTLAAAGVSLDRLRAQLEPLVGVAGFRALVSRALALARREADGLDGVTVAANGSLDGLDEAERAVAPGERAAAAAAVLSQVLGLLVAFVGEDLTTRLVSKACPDAPEGAGGRTEENAK